MNKTPFAILQDSPWPLLNGFALLALTTGGVLFFQGVAGGLTTLWVTFIILLLGMGVWFRDVIREGLFLGKHTLTVKMMLKYGMVLFILSEALFFGSFFWALFHNSLSPTVELGAQWPPAGIDCLDPLGIPLLNTLLLLSSGASATWAHHASIIGNRVETLWGLMVTLFLGVTFTVLQGLEYVEAPFTITDSVYGSTFFVATGFHGIHVLIGTIFLAAIFVRAYRQTLNSWTQVGFWSAIMYWHFVDVVWLFLYVCIYVWAS